MERVTSDGLHIVVHDNTQEVLDHISKTDKSFHSHDPNRGGFNNGSWSEAVTRVDRGWDECTEKTADFGDKLVHLMANARPDLDKVEFHEEGEWVDISRYLDGEPIECWGTFVEGNPKPVRSLNIIVNMTAVCFVDEAAMRMRGAAISFLIDWFRRRGINCQVWVVIPTEDCDNWKDCIDVYKIDTTEGHSLSQLTAYLAMPDFLRRVHFAVMEVESGRKRLSGYGIPRELLDEQQNLKIMSGTKEQKEYLLELFGGEEALKKTLYFEQCTNDWKSFDFTVGRICKIIDDFNGTHEKDC